MTYAKEATSDGGLFALVMVRILRLYSLISCESLGIWATDRLVVIAEGLHLCFLLYVTCIGPYVTMLEYNMNLAVKIQLGDYWAFQG